MIDASGIVPDMEVYAADQVHLGSVDVVQGDRLMLNTVASSVPVEPGQDHYVQLGDIARIEGNRIHMATNGVDAVHPRPGAAAADDAERGPINAGATLNR